MSVGTDMTWTRARAVLGSLVAAIIAAPGCKDTGAPPAPVTVIAVSPANDLLGGGSSLTITGTNFISVTSVTIGGNELGGRSVVSTTEPSEKRRAWGPA